MKQFIIYIPGLGDRKTYAWAQKFALNLWRSKNVMPYYFAVGWADKHESYEQKRSRLIKAIDTAIHDGYTVSVVAASAGANLAVTALATRPERIHRVVSICGKINRPESVSDAILALNPAFKDAMADSQHSLQKLTQETRKKILIVRALRDSYVPAADGAVPGAHMRVIYSIGHALSIFMAITIFRHVCLRFIRRQD